MICAVKMMIVHPAGVLNFVIQWCGYVEIKRLMEGDAVLTMIVFPAGVMRHAKISWIMERSECFQDEKIASLTGANRILNVVNNDGTQKCKGMRG